MIRRCSVVLPQVLRRSILSPKSIEEVSAFDCLSL
nr:MAG TPA: hypothetical protein [Microviridae sp.]